MFLAPHMVLKGVLAIVGFLTGTARPLEGGSCCNFRRGTLSGQHLVGECLGGQGWKRSHSAFEVIAADKHVSDQERRHGAKF